MEFYKCIQSKDLIFFHNLILSFRTLTCLFEVLLTDKSVILNEV